MKYTKRLKMKGFTKKQKIKKNLKGFSISYFPSPPAAAAAAALFIFIVENNIP